MNVVQAAFSGALDLLQKRVHWQPWMRQNIHSE